MNKEEILQLLKQKNIITKNNKRKFCWKKYWDNEIEYIFNQFKQQYRTDEEAWFCLLHNIEPYYCEICGNLAKFTGTLKTKNIGYNTTCENCSPNLAPNKLKIYHESINNRTKEERKQILQKRKQTNLEKYGDENYTLFGSKSFKDNLKKKYGYEYNTQIPEIKEKIKQTNLEKYGVTCNLCVNASERTKKIWDQKYKEIIYKIKQTNINNLGVEFVGQSQDVINKIINKKRINVSNIETKYNCTQQIKLFKKYGQGWKDLHLDMFFIKGRKFISNEYLPLIEKYFNEGRHNNTFVSNKEKELLEYIKTIYNDKILENSTNIVANNNYRYYELDIYLPKKHIAFEFNGSYWHSSIYKDKYYHQRKTILCYLQGVQLIHIWEYDWDNNKEQIMYQIKKLLNDEDCTKYNWISLNNYNQYKLTEPEEIHYGNLIIFNEGKFIKK